MKKILKISAFVITGILALILVAIAYISIALPNVGPPEEMQIEITEERVAHGKYLAHHVMLCVDCHSVRDFELFAGPPIQSTLAAGGEVFDKKEGFPGTFISPNLTPFNLKDWTDGEIFRAITTGVRKDGSAIFPVMPYGEYSKADAEDVKAVIAYLRTLGPVETNHPKSKPDFPFNIILNTMPKKANLSKRPDPKQDQVAYGGYLATISGCAECHTRFENGAFVGERLAGGREFEFPEAMLVTPNLTPHESGIGNWTKEMFVQRFKMYGDNYIPEKVKPGDFQTIMPWIMYAGMDESDLEAIYTYLKSLQPVENYVEKFQAKK